MHLVGKEIDHFQCSKQFSAPSAPEFMLTEEWSCQLSPFFQTPQFWEGSIDPPPPPAHPRPLFFGVHRIRKNIFSGIRTAIETGLATQYTGAGTSLQKKHVSCRPREEEMARIAHTISRGGGGPKSVFCASICCVSQGLCFLQLYSRHTNLGGAGIFPIRKPPVCSVMQSKTAFQAACTLFG